MHKKAVAYLAYTHATGWRPTHMHSGTRWSTPVLLGTNYDSARMRWTVAEEYHAELAEHPFVKLVAEYKAQGFTIIDRSNWKRRLISRGIPMLNDDTKQEISVMEDGKVRQHTAPGGKWEYIDNIRSAAHA
jgi:hypothetical protein